MPFITLPGKRGLLQEQDLHRIGSLITSLGFGDQWKAFNTAFVLPLRIGEVTVVNDICEEELTKSLEQSQASTSGGGL